mmetsp:Transcript_61916/g.157436  ORF Transcript_61916/g.157436 Transcript_61916/m.157436 type:complete len:275 (-) Transcript_61916:9-833(-)
MSSRSRCTPSRRRADNRRSSCEEEPHGGGGPGGGGGGGGGAAAAAAEALLAGLPAPAEAPLAAALARGLERRYRLDAGGLPGHDYLVRRHPNGLLVISLAPTHPLLLAPTAAASDSAAPSSSSPSSPSGATKRPRPASVVWRKGVAGEEASGKRCKGGANLGHKAQLGEVHLSDGAVSIPLFTCVTDARLVELNGRLEGEPQLLQDSPEDEGFVAILQPWHAQNAAKALEGLLTEAAFASRRAGVLTGPPPAGPAWAPALGAGCSASGSVAVPA